MGLVRLICEQPTPKGQDGEPVVFDLDPHMVNAKIKSLKAAGWEKITQVNLLPNCIAVNDSSNSSKRIRQEFQS